MEDAPRILKRKRENLLAGNLKVMYFWAQSLESCKPIEWGDPTDLSLSFCTAGNNISHGGFAVSETIPGVCSSCPTLELLWHKFICRLRWGEECSGSFSQTWWQMLSLSIGWTLSQERAGGDAGLHFASGYSLAPLSTQRGLGKGQCLISLHWKLLVGWDQTGIYMGQN